ncbi:MAG TPA: hypothetical protein PK664_08725 [Paludibacteraceae bacterium]|nr:hypothetical protein [Paludibacteraceae bacterium]
MKSKNLSGRKWGILIIVVILLSLTGYYVYNNSSLRYDYEITDDLGGNIFPSAILSIATTDAQIIIPSDTMYLGNPKSIIGVRVRSSKPLSHVRVEVAETKFYAQSVSEFDLPKPDIDYIIYPDIIWNYEALKNNSQPEPISVVVDAEINGKKIGRKIQTFSVRSINECLLGYYTKGRKFHDTGIFFAAYVNEDHPMIDQILREALNTRIVNKFLGYQARNAAAAVDKQVYALWNVLQKRNFRYSSVSNTSLSSNVVISQRVRTFEDALNSSQINCVDGSVLFASLLRAINIEPILVRIPGHMFVGYYTDSNRKNVNFLETTMIGDVDLDDFFPDEQLDSTMVGQSKNQVSLITFEKSKEYATNKYNQHKEFFNKGKANYLFLEISKGVRRKIQPIGK